MKIIDIKNNSDIDLLNKLVDKKKLLAVDTEFIRENTYYPILSLIQIAVDDTVFIFDYIKNNSKQIFLSEILESKINIKIFHDCEQDLEILNKNLNIHIENIFDTQLGNAFVDFDHHISYKNLVKKILNIDIDKNQQNSDWLHRPLSKQQLRYAAGDVIYLENIYIKLKDDLIIQNKFEWFKEDMEKVIRDLSYKTLPENSWEKIKINDRNKINIELLKIIAKNREIISRSRNIPKSWFLKDRDIIKISTEQYENYNIFKKLNLTSNKFFEENDNKDIYDIYENYKNGTYKNKDKKINVKHAQKILSKISMNTKISETLIANKKDLEKFLSNPKKNLPLGWRKQIFESIKKEANDYFLS